MSESFADMYAAELAHLRSGYAIYEPDPGNEQPVQIGDVGYISSLGKFRRAFNALYDGFDPINSKNGVPSDFVKLPDIFKESTLDTSLTRGHYVSQETTVIGITAEVNVYVVYYHFLSRVSLILTMTLQWQIHHPCRRKDRYVKHKREGCHSLHRRG